MALILHHRVHAQGCSWLLSCTWAHVHHENWDCTAWIFPLHFSLGTVLNWSRFSWLKSVLFCIYMTLIQQNLSNLLFPWWSQEWATDRTNRTILWWLLMMLLAPTFAVISLVDIFIFPSNFTLKVLDAFLLNEQIDHILKHLILFSICHARARLLSFTFNTSAAGVMTKEAAMATAARFAQVPIRLLRILAGCAIELIEVQHWSHAPLSLFGIFIVLWG